MGQVSNYAFYVPFRVRINQPPRGFVVQITAHTEAGLQLELGLLCSNACCWNGCKYHSGQQAMQHLPPEQGGPTREKDGTNTAEELNMGNNVTGRE